MHNEIYNLIRLTMIILAIIAFVILCVTDKAQYQPIHEEAPYQEPAEIESL